jgi:ClpP class serine protease
VAHLLPSTGTPRPTRAAWRESPTGEALAFDRWRFSGALGGTPGELRHVRPGAFGLFFDCPAPLGFLDPQTGQPREGAIEEGGIAVLSVVGPLEHQDAWWWASYHAIRREVEAALAWPSTTAVALKLDTPGGVCAGMLACHRALRALRAKYRKPLVAFVDELAASAGYGIASACDDIWLPPEGVVGSIGVILCTVDESKRLEKEGIAVRYVVTGARKGDMQPGAPITDDVLAVAQEKVDELGALFFEAVGTAREMSPAAVEGLEAAVFMGEAAVDAGLADGVADWPEFLGTLRRSLGATVAQTTVTPGGGTPKAKGDDMQTRMQAQKARDEAHERVRVAQAAVAAASGTAVAKAVAALTDALAKATEADAAMAKVTHRMKHEEVTVEQPDSEEPAASVAPATAKSEPAASGMPGSDAPPGSEEEEEAAYSEKKGKAAAARTPGTVQVPKGWGSAQKAYKGRAQGSGSDAYGVLHGPLALLNAAAKATGQATIEGILGALAAIPERLANANKVETRVAALEKTSRAQRVEAVLASARTAGKVGGKSHRDHLRAEGLKHGSKWLAGHLAVAPVVVRTLASGGHEAKEGDDGRGQFTAATDEQAKLLAQMTADMTPAEREQFEKDFKANLAARGPKVPAV